MAGSLIKIEEIVISSATGSVILNPIDSTYDVYMITVNNFAPTTDGATPIFRVTKGGTAQTGGDYDYAVKQLRTDATFGNNYEANIDSFKVNDVGTGTGEVANMVLYLFNFPNASEYSFITQETTQISSSGLHRGRQGSAVHTVASASDGMEFKMASGNIASGTFTLYGLKK
jgi:hypothetical protein